MSTEKLGQEPAFPLDSQYKGEKMRFTGISKRLYLAGMAMQGVLSSQVGWNEESSGKWIVQHSLEIADELLKQEQL